MPSSSLGTPFSFLENHWPSLQRMGMPSSSTRSLPLPSMCCRRVAAFVGLPFLISRSRSVQTVLFSFCACSFLLQLMSREDSRMWFGEVVPGLARLLLRLPSLLEAHYRYSDRIFGSGIAGLRVLYSQEAGIVFLSQVSFRSVLSSHLFKLKIPILWRTRFSLSSDNNHDREFF